MTEVQELVARLRLKDEMSGPIRKVWAGISGVSDALNSPRMKAGIHQVGTGLRNAALIGAAGIGILASQVALGLRSLVELENATAQTEAVIKSTGGAAGITAEKVSELSEKFEGLNATVGDEFVRAGANMLLTFTNIRGKAFEPALQAVLDMNQAMGKGPEGLTSTAILVGKALNDPTKGLTALTRVGVTFTAQQIKQIKALQKSGDLLGAQKIVLAELNTEFGGSFLAGGNTTAGKVAKFTDAINDLQRVLATALLPVVSKVADGLTKMLQDPSVIQGAKDIGNAIAGLFNDENIATGGALLKEVFATAKAAAPTILAAAKATVAIVGSAVSLFRSLPPEIQQLAIGAFAINKLTGGLVTNIAGGLISSVLKQLVSGVVNVNGAVVNVNGAGIPGVGPAPAAATAAGGVKGAIKTIATLAVPIVAGLMAADAVADATGAKAQFARDQEAARKSGKNSMIVGKGGPQPVVVTSAPAFEKNIRSLRDSVVNSNDRDEARAALARATAITNAEGIKQTQRTTGMAAVTAASSIKAATDAAALASRNAGVATASAIRDKDLSIVTNISVPVTVSVRETIKTQTTFKKFGNTAS